MKRNVLTAIAFLVGVLALVGAFLLREANRSFQYSCAASLTVSVQEVATQFPPTPLGKDWRVLSESEATSLMHRVNGYDCDGSAKPNGVVLDPWGRPYVIAARIQSSELPVEIRLWSAGRDGRSGTDDDVVAPYGEQAIVQP
jgi:hypothetical protein